MKKERIHRKSKVCGTEAVEMDTVAVSKRDGSRRAFDILMEAQHHWGNMDRYRKDRERNKRYCYGDQWLDSITVDGKTMTEEEYIARQGNMPLKNNLIRRLVRNVLGVYRSQSKEPTCYARDRDEQKLGETMSTILQCNMQLNRMSEVLARTMEEFLIGGLIVHKKTFGWRNGKMDCWTDYVNPNNFFIDSNMRDFRMWDVSFIGEVHDISFGELCGAFAKSAADYKRLRDIYTFARDKQHLAAYAEEFGYSRLQNYDFLFTSDPTRCRVIEVWRTESKPRYRCHDFNSGEVYKVNVEDYQAMVVAKNEERLAKAAQFGIPENEVPLIEAEWFIDQYWYYYYLTPFGDILGEGESPYAHGSHPYVVKAYPYIDGEVHSFVGDVIDQQRYTNRLVTLYDFIMRTSAKGVLLFPEGCEPDGMSMEEIAEQWGKVDGIVYYKPKPGVPMPQQIANNATNIGISELLQLQLKFFEDISGVNGALQGKQGYSGTSAALYNQQTQNATTSLLDIMDVFSDFVRDGAMKDIKNMQQFYDSKRMFNIVGKNAWVEYDPERISDVDFDLSIVESTNTPSYRQLANDMLLQLWQAQAIDVEQLLEHGDFPFADALLQSIQSKKQDMEQQQRQQAEMQQQMALQQGIQQQASAQEMPAQQPPMQ